MRTVIFDFDDTLVITNPVFDQAKEQFCRLMKHEGIYAPDILETLDRFDIANVEKAGGFAKDCFPRALLQTYEYYCRVKGRTVSAETRMMVERLGWWAVEKVPEVKRGAEQILARLQKAYFLVLLSKGDRELQRERIRATGLDKYFNHIEIVLQKDASLYRRIVRDTGALAEESWSVGNSFKSDINPALEAGLQCILVRSSSWGYEEEPPKGPYIEVLSLELIPDIILRRKTRGTA
ncbi:HAD family hydrolase [Calderihabitans maritimus]|uniref:Haloacid dehalogenase domain-containing protein hydrolase n=1 Tax=Calderihabitans maritimus TaxID=1246530 RepID=A0A1Z5HRC1_9FIRM|nr:HAD family hydrolase [Calderihabitans maritimus]GAW91871.1 haloacid dehalogenase domain-containing protein hydrolase [Calderihabitans maritimus]